MRRRVRARLTTVTARVHKEKGKWGRTRSLSLRNSLVSKKMSIKDSQAIAISRGIQKLSPKDIHLPRKSRVGLIAEDTHPLGTILNSLLHPILLRSLTATLMDCSLALYHSSLSSLRWHRCPWRQPIRAVRALRERKRANKRRDESDAMIANRLDIILEIMCLWRSEVWSYPPFWTWLGTRAQVCQKWFLLVFFYGRWSSSWFLSGGWYSLWWCARRSRLIDPCLWLSAICHHTYPRWSSLTLRQHQHTLRSYDIGRVGLNHLPHLIQDRCTHLLTHLELLNIELSLTKHTWYLIINSSYQTDWEPHLHLDCRT